MNVAKNIVLRGDCVSHEVIYEVFKVVGSMICMMVAIVCITINAIHKRNKKAELIKEAIKQGHSVKVGL